VDLAVRERFAAAVARLRDRGVACDDGFVARDFAGDDERLAVPALLLGLARRLLV
jgi:hypothetical protein